MKKYIKFKELKDTNGSPCYQIMNNKDEWIGDIYLEKLTPRSGFKWMFYPFQGDVRNPIFWTIECLEQLTDFIKQLTKQK